MNIKGLMSVEKELITSVRRYAYENAEIGHVMEEVVVDPSYWIGEIFNTSDAFHKDEILLHRDISIALYENGISKAVENKKLDKFMILPDVFSSDMMPTSNYGSNSTPDGPPVRVEALRKLIMVNGHIFDIMKVMYVEDIETLCYNGKYYLFYKSGTVAANILEAGNSLKVIDINKVTTIDFDNVTEFTSDEMESNPELLVYRLDIYNHIEFFPNGIVAITDKEESKKYITVVINFKHEIVTYRDEDIITTNGKIVGLHSLTPLDVDIQEKLYEPRNGNFYVRHNREASYASTFIICYEDKSYDIINTTGVSKYITKIDKHTIEINGDINGISGKIVESVLLFSKDVLKGGGGSGSNTVEDRVDFLYDKVMAVNPWGFYALSAYRKDTTVLLNWLNSSNPEIEEIIEYGYKHDKDILHAIQLALPTYIHSKFSDAVKIRKSGNVWRPYVYIENPMKLLPLIFINGIMVKAINNIYNDISTVVLLEYERNYHIFENLLCGEGNRIKNVFSAIMEEVNSFSKTLVEDSNNDELVVDKYNMLIESKKLDSVYKLEIALVSAQKTNSGIMHPVEDIPNISNTGSGLLSINSAITSTNNRPVFVNGLITCPTITTGVDSITNDSTPDEIIKSKRKNSRICGIEKLIVDDIVAVGDHGLDTYLITSNMNNKMLSPASTGIEAVLFNDSIVRLDGRSASDIVEAGGGADSCVFNVDNILSPNGYLVFNELSGRLSIDSLNMISDSHAIYDSKHMYYSDKEVISDLLVIRLPRINNCSFSTIDAEIDNSVAIQNGYNERSIYVNPDIVLMFNASGSIGRLDTTIFPDNQLNTGEVIGKYITANTVISYLLSSYGVLPIDKVSGLLRPMNILEYNANMAAIGVLDGFFTSELGVVDYTIINKEYLAKYIEDNHIPTSAFFKPHYTSVLREDHHLYNEKNKYEVSSTSVLKYLDIGKSLVSNTMLAAMSNEVGEFGRGVTSSIYKYGGVEVASVSVGGKQIIKRRATVDTLSIRGKLVPTLTASDNWSGAGNHYTSSKNSNGSISTNLDNVMSLSTGGIHLVDKNVRKFIIKE